MGNPAEENDRMPDGQTITNPDVRLQDLFYPDLHGNRPGEVPGARNSEVSDTSLFREKLGMNCAQRRQFAFGFIMAADLFERCAKAVAGLPKIGLQS